MKSSERGLSENIYIIDVFLNTKKVIAISNSVKVVLLTNFWWFHIYRAIWSTGGVLMCLLIFLRFFQKYPFSEVSNIRWTSKIYSQRAEMFVYKIRESGDDRNTFSNFFWRLQKFCLTPIAQNWPFLQPFEIDKISKKIKKNRFFQNEWVFYPDNDKWKHATWWGCFAPKRVRTLLLRRK